MIARDLTFINLGNESKIEGLVNFEKLRMMAKEVSILLRIYMTEVKWQKCSPSPNG